VGNLYLVTLLLIVGVATARHLQSATASPGSKRVVGALAAGAVLAYLLWPLAALPALLVLVGVGGYALLHSSLSERPQ
jgi:hypothetical protein